MEIEKLISALEETISYLHRSESWGGSEMPPEEIIRRLKSEMTKAQNAKPVDIILLDRLFAPTSVIQETSIHNGWGTRFLRIAEVIDQFTRSGK